MLLKHKYLFISLLFLTIAAINLPTHAQAAARLDSLNNKFALQFQISQNFTLASFQGTTFSGKYNIGTRSALRIGLSVDMNDVKSEYTSNPVDTSAIFNGSSEQNLLGITIRTQYLHYIPSEHNIAFFMGGGPFIGYTKGTMKSYENAYIPDFERKFETETFNAGIDLLIGVEWMFAEYMSLSAEYGIMFAYYSREDSNIDNFSEHSSNDTVYRISRGNLNFGLTVYF